MLPDHSHRAVDKRKCELMESMDLYPVPLTAWGWISFRHQHIYFHIHPPGSSSTSSSLSTSSPGPPSSPFSSLKDQEGKAVLPTYIITIFFELILIYWYSVLHPLQLTLYMCPCLWHNISLNVNSPRHVDVVWSCCFQIQPKFINTLVTGQNLTGHGLAKAAWNFHLAIKVSCNPIGQYRCASANLKLHILRLFTYKCSTRWIDRWFTNYNSI